MLWNYLIIILTINLLIFVHELGHYLCIKFLNFKINKFVVGLGPKLFSFKKNDISYEFGILPIGGYVNSSNLFFFNNNKNYYLNFLNKIIFLLKMFFIFFSGPFLNLLFSCLFFFIFFFCFGINVSLPLLKDSNILINKHDYYKILSIDNNKIYDSHDLLYLIKKKYNRNIYIKILNLSNKKIFLILLKINKKNINSILSFLIQNYNLYIYKNKNEKLSNIFLYYLKNCDIIYMINNRLIINNNYINFLFKKTFLNFKKKINLKLIRNNQFFSVDIPMSIWKKEKRSNFFFFKKDFLFKKKWSLLKSIIFSLNKVNFLIKNILKILINIFYNYKFLLNLNSSLFLFKKYIFFVNNLNNYLFFLSYLNINLFILNLLPLFPLDGGMLLFWIFKLFFYKDIVKYYCYFSNIFLLFLLFFVFLKDLIIIFY